LLQEQNSFAGKSNKILGKKASAICIAYDGMEKFFPKNNLFYTGNPVRQTITENKATRTEAASFFELDETKKIIFVFGGSLGARSINEAMADGLNALMAEKTQLIWQTGTNYFEKAKEAIKGFESQIKVFDFIREMDKAYAIADIIIARAGASSIAELCIVGKPVIFIPFPFASEDHQTHNAMALVKKNAAMLITDSNCKLELIPKIKMLLHNTQQQSMMKSTIQTLAITNADKKIANKLIELAQS
jgi:UDP-N-acetylglucosamine--N-acetylmuramyl-(pentapeptide) pyrophosphoryl-undecaprenol N-acetylglucosamine transferase